MNIIIGSNMQLKTLILSQIFTTLQMSVARVCYAFVLFGLLRCSAGESIPTNITLLVESYENNVNTSLALEKSDKDLVKIWTVDFQVMRINITTKHRLQMTRHKEHSFKRTDSNAKWSTCIDLHKKEIRRSERNYYKHETECLKSTSALDTDKKHSVEQVDKEIRKWRKGFRYLQHLCDVNNLNDEDGSKNCLVEYMQRDNYNQVIERLMIIKLEVMGDLYLHYTNSLIDLEECLARQLSKYLDKVRAIMDVLNKCYL